MSVDCRGCGSADCGCCEGVAAETPLAVENRPGLSAIAYRIGTHARFKQSLLAGLSASPDEQLRRLDRRDDDPTIALLDAWAAVADVLTFYQERIANEQYLRTATELRSVREMVRLLDYRPSPGVAASAYLAFRLERGPGAPAAVTIEPGVAVQSVPGPGETPQTFETIETVEAHAELDALRARQSEPWPLAGRAEVWLDGATTGLARGDGLLFVPPALTAAGARFRRVLAVEVDRDRNVTRVTLDQALDADIFVVFALRKRAPLFGYNAPSYRVLPKDVRANFEGTAPGDPAEPAPDEWPELSIRTVSDQAEGDITTLHLDGAHPEVAAESWIVLTAHGATPSVHRVTDAQEDAREGFALAGKTTRIVLDPAVPADFDGRLRAVVVHGASEPLIPTDRPLFDPLPAGPDTAATIVLATRVPALEAGRRAIVTGPRARVRLTADVEAEGAGEAMVALAEGDELEVLAVAAVDEGGRRWSVRTATGVEATIEEDGDAPFAVVRAPDDAEIVGELVTVDAVTDDGARTTVELTAPLTHVYDRAAATIAANVVAATHGQTVAGEVLGSGDAGVPWQSFTLAQSPLTHVRSAEAGGAESTLEVRVGGVRWAEVPSFYGRGPRERVYVTRPDTEGNVVVRFGDGVAGARPPSGDENVTATYRKGTGREGIVGADRLTLPVKRPLGVRSVTNPLPAEGAEDPEGLEDAREAAPLTVVTLGRIVSLDDYAAFARAFLGIAKAHAAWTWSDDRRGVLVTVAGTEGDPVPEGSATYASLLTAMLDAVPRHELPGVETVVPLTPIRLETYRPARFHLRAAVRIDPDHPSDTVLGAVEARLREAFSFAARDFGQAVARSEVIALIQAVPGVVGVRLETLHRAEQDPALAEGLPAHAPRSGEPADTAQPGEILTLHPAPMRGPGADLSVLREWK